MTAWHFLHLEFVAFLACTLQCRKCSKPARNERLLKLLMKLLINYVRTISRAAYQHESEFMGVPTLRFSATRELFAHPDEFPENACYCVPPRPPLDPACAPTGVVRLRSCKTGKI